MKPAQGGGRGTIILASVTALLLIVFIANISHKNKSPSDPQPVATHTQPQESLAERTQEAMIQSFGFTSLQDMQTAEWPSDSNMAYISSFDDVSTGTVRMTIQKDVTADEARQVGITVMAAVGTDLQDLRWIVARGTNGRDVNISRNDVPALRN